MTIRLAAAALAVASAGAVATSAGAGGFLYATLFAVALVPGLPVGFAMFGRRHAAGWIAGAALGYFFTALALWAAIALHVPTAVGFASAWAVALLITFGATRSQGTPWLTVAPWTRRDSLSLLLVLLLVPAIAGPPFARVGARDDEGNRYYRAYFTADFVWHLAVTSELEKFVMPPRNMFMPDRPLDYYWAYYVLPAAAAGAGPRPLRSVENNLEVNAIGTALLFVSAIFLLAWIVVPNGPAVAAAVGLAIVASSAEGFYEICRLLARGTPLSALRNVNVDAISNWRFGGLRIDGLPRCFWWVPQHSMAYVMGLVGLAVVSAEGSGVTLAASAAGGLALAGAVAFDPFVGALFALVWGLSAAIDAIPHGDRLQRILRASFAAVPVAAALAWCLANHMAGRAPSIVQFGLLGNARHRPLWNLLLSLGPGLAPAVVGVFAIRRAASPARFVPAGLLVLICLAVMHLVRLAVDDSWVGFRTGQIVLATLPVFAAAAFALPSAARKIAGTVALAAMLLGLPTTLVDLYNAQDITNRSQGPGFPWTEVLDYEHVEAVDWLKRATPPTAVVQLDPTSRGETTWTVIPSFGERRMATSLPRTLVDDPAYHERSARVRRLFATTDPREASTIAHELHIDYIWVDGPERRAYPEGVRKFEGSRVFRARVPQCGGGGLQSAVGSESGIRGTDGWGHVPQSPTFTVAVHGPTAKARRPRSPRSSRRRHIRRVPRGLSASRSSTGSRVRATLTVILPAPTARFASEVRVRGPSPGSESGVRVRRTDGCRPRAAVTDVHCRGTRADGNCAKATKPAKLTKKTHPGGVLAGSVFAFQHRMRFDL